MISARNAGLWLVSLLLSVSVFSSIYGRLYGFASFAFVFRITMIFAAPIACLCIPVVLSVSGRRAGIPIIVATGSLIGPFCLVIWFLLAGALGKQVWADNGGVGFSFVTELACAFVIGFLTTIFYTIALKLIQSLRLSPK